MKGFLKGGAVVDIFVNKIKWDVKKDSRRIKNRQQALACSRL